MCWISILYTFLLLCTLYIKTASTGFQDSCVSCDSLQPNWPIRTKLVYFYIHVHVLVAAASHASSLEVLCVCVCVCVCICECV